MCRRTRLADAVAIVVILAKSFSGSLSYESPVPGGECQTLFRRAAEFISAGTSRRDKPGGSLVSLWFPNSVWEPRFPKLGFATRLETEFRGRAFPNGVWERGNEEPKPGFWSTSW